MLFYVMLCYVMLLMDYNFLFLIGVSLLVYIYIYKRKRMDKNIEVSPLIGFISTQPITVFLS